MAWQCAMHNPHEVDFFDSESWAVEGGIQSIGTRQSNVTLGKREHG